MFSFAGLLKREWLEHRAAFVWGPAIVLLVILLAGISAVTMEGRLQTDLSGHDASELAEKLGREPDGEMGVLEMATAMALDVAGSTDAELQRNMATLLNGLAVPFHIVFIVIAFFALLACLYDERKDQSILFWKSMPVSNLATVASKLVFVTWCAPLVTIAAIIVAQFFVVTLSSLHVEEGMGGRIWAASDVWSRPFGLVLRYFLLGLWALPFCSWVMFVSSCASRLPVLWILGIPWLVFLLERIIIGTNGLSQMVGEHFSLLTSALGSGAASHFAILTDPAMWGGVVIAVLFLAGAVFFRGRNNEL
jgi:ABC-2 type transport system permease protein